MTTSTRLAIVTAVFASFAGAQSLDFALHAAAWLAHRAPGRYRIGDLLG